MTEKNPVKPRGSGPFTLWMIVALIVIVLDQLSKWVIVRWVPLYDRISVTAFLNITHQKNTGAAFSFLAGASGWQRWFFIALALAVSIAIVVWLWRLRYTRQLVLSAGLALVVGGALGNVIDRIRIGYVTDFIEVWIAGWPFPSFNVADSCITVGAALLIVDALFLSGRKQAMGEGT